MKIFTIIITAFLPAMMFGSPAFGEVPTITEAEQQVEALRNQIAECQELADDATSSLTEIKSLLDTAGDAVSEDVNENVVKLSRQPET